MAKNLNDLANILDAKAAKIQTQQKALVNGVVLTIVGDLAYKTPVDTSKALSSWIVSTGTPSSVVGTAHFPGSHGSTQRASAQQTLAEAKAVLAQRKPGETVFITNNQPYIDLLDKGYSKQQPAGMVARAVLLGRVFIRNFKFKL